MSQRPRSWRSWLPLAVLLVASGTLGAALYGSGSIPSGVPDTPFTDGHLVALHLGVDWLRDGAPDGLWTRQVRWPDGAAFHPLLWPVLALAWLVGPVAALVVTWVGTPVVNALGGYVLAHVAGASTRGAVLAGGLLAWGPWVRVTLRNGQLEQATLGLVAVVWAVVLWASRGGPGRSAWLALVVLGVGLAEPHATVAALLAMPVVLLLAPGEGARPAARVPRAILLLVVSGTAAVAISAFHEGGLDAAASVFHPRRSTDQTHVSYAPLAALWTLPGASLGRSPVLHCVYLGAVLLVGGVLSLRRWRQSGPWLVVAAWCTVLALGPQLLVAGQRVWLPLALLDQLVPSLAESGGGYRLVMGAVVGLALAIGLAANRLPWLVLAVVVGLSWADAARLSLGPLVVPVRPARHHPQLTALEHADGAVLDLPLATLRCDHAAAHMANGVLAHGLPLLHDLDSPASYGDHRVHALILERSPTRCAEALGAGLADLGVGAVVLHHDVCDVTRRLVECLETGLGPASGEVAGEVSWWVLPTTASVSGP